MGRYCRHDAHTLCADCEIPLCRTCYIHCTKRTGNIIAMCLANDNYWGYTTEIIYQYQVRWIEAAIVAPCWTTMVVYYVEGDGGHLMTEKMGQQQFRIVVRGTCVSYHMPWEDIMDVVLLRKRGGQFSR